MDTSKIIIETERLYIKSITFEYAKEMFEELNDKITTYMYPRPADNIQETENFIRKSIKENVEGSNFQTIIIEKNNLEFLGCAGINKINTKTPELGIWIKNSAHGNGYGKETIVYLKKWADKNLNYKYLLYPVDINNIASRKIPEFFKAKVAREYEEKNMSGKILNLLEYRIYPDK